VGERALAELALYAARPTLRVDGREHRIVSELLTAMEMRECEGGPSSLELRFSNFASEPGGGARLAFEDETVLALGKAIAAYAGDALSPQAIFDGHITAIEAEFSHDVPPELVVLAEDALQAARMARRTAVYEDMSVADIANAIAGRLGLTPRITALDRTARVHVQWNESDLAFLRRILSHDDGDVQVVEDELHVSPRGDVRRAEVELRLFGQLHAVRVTADLAHQVTKTSITGWNPATGQRVRATGTGASLGPGRGRTGAAVLRDTLGERAEHVGGVAVETDATATAVADAAFDGRARRFVVAEGTAEGNPALRVGTHVTLSGISTRFDNTYYIVRTTHRFDNRRGYETDFEAECAYLGSP
jgi:phage protein D